MQMHPDHSNYYRFHKRSAIDKAINTLLGIIEGVTADGKINDIEADLMSKWMNAHKLSMDCHPFNEFIPVLSEALSDGMLSEEERSNIIWLCDKLSSTDYFDSMTADMQRLHAIVGAIAYDGVITEEELNGLAEWMKCYSHLRRCWPYDEIEAVITEVMADRKIDEKEHEYLQHFFKEFVPSDASTIIQAPILSGGSIQGLCTVCPEIHFKNSVFCLTGASQKYKRKQFADVINELGGRVINSINHSLDYLIIGAKGNPCWSYACYGRKVEQAVALRKIGNRLLLVHENDFHDAVEHLN